MALKYRDEFKLFKYQQDITYRAPLTKEKLRKEFKKLLDMPVFDGVKEINDSTTDKTWYIKLTTSDNKMKLVLDEQELSISYLNDIFSEKPSNKSQQEVATLLTAIIDEQQFDIDFIHYRRVWVSVEKKVKKAVFMEVMDPLYADKVDSLDIELDFTDYKSEDDERPSHYAKVTTLHTTEMHESFKRVKKEKSLNDLIVIDEFRVIGDEIALLDAQDFLNTESKRDVVGPEI